MMPIKTVSPANRPALGLPGARRTRSLAHRLNPWDFVVMREGAVLFVAHATRRLGTNTQSRTAAPFAVSAQGAGYASTADSDESQRGKPWMPLWSQPATLSELTRKVWEKLVTLSRGSKFQKELTRKDYEYVGQLKQSKHGKDTVQIDDLI